MRRLIFVLSVAVLGIGGYWQRPPLLSAAEQRITISPPCPPEQRQWYIELSYTYTSPALTARSLSLSLAPNSENDAQNFTVIIHAEGGALQFYSDRLTAMPTAVVIHDADSWLTVTAARCHAYLPFPHADNADQIHAIDAQSIATRNDFGARCV